jgi:SAM-dependent methyltransferase
VPVQAALSVQGCPLCSHVQTPPLDAIEAYYDRNYNFQTAHIDEDDLYGVEHGRNLYRSEHQARVVERRFDLTQPLRVLDFGCGKAPTLRRLTERHPRIVPHVFDVSEAYMPFWDGFVPKAQQAAHRPPDAWLGQMDVVLSFFALEHVSRPRDFVRTLHRLLRPGGTLHLIVPNMHRNVGDFLVIDHVNHFSTPSMCRLLEDAGFADLQIDDEVHQAALTVRAVRRSGDVVAPPAVARQEVEAAFGRALEIAAYWAAMVERVGAAEQRAADKKAAIYGSGVYGLFILSSLARPDRVAYFLDMNPYRQTLTLFGHPVIAPQAIEDDVDVVYVGLNPRSAPAIIDNVPSLHAVRRQFVFL